MGKKSKKSSLDVAPAAAVPKDAVTAKPDDEFVETAEEAAYRNRETMNAVLVLLFFSVLMFSLPFAAFFGVRYYLGVHLHVYGFPNTCWSVLAAVVTANIIIVAYVLKAYRDNQAEVAREKALKSN